MKCPKCGYENRDEAHFCSECGADLSSEKFSCPQCGAVVHKENKHCINCGKELAWVDVDYDSIPIPIKHHAYKSFEKRLHSTKGVQTEQKGVLRYILSGILLLGILFLFIGLFGDFIKGTASTIGLKYDESASSLTYYFKDIYTNIQNLEISDKYGYVYEFELFLMVVDVIAYYSMFILVITFATLSTINLVKHIMKKSDINYYFLLPMVFSALLHIMVVMLTEYVAVNVAGEGFIKITLGWGSILLLIGSLLIVACIMFERLAKIIINRENATKIAASSLSIVSDILSFVLMLLAFGFIINIAEYSEVAIKMPINPTFTIRYIASLYPDNMKENFVKAYELSYSGFLILFISAILYLANYAVNLKNNSIAKIVIGGFSFIAMLVGEFLILSSANRAFVNNVGLSAGGVFIIICGLLSLGTLIASNVLKRR